jgi:hypothetical protein
MRSQHEVPIFYKPHETEGRLGQMADVAYAILPMRCLRYMCKMGLAQVSLMIYNLDSCGKTSALLLTSTL